MHDLPLQRDEHESDEVEKKNRPKDWYVEYFEECQRKSYHRCLCEVVPKFEFRQSADKWTEFIARTGR